MPDPEQRYTAQQLLEHPFIKETLAPKKKKKKKMTEVEYLRSTSSKSKKDLSSLL